MEELDASQSRGIDELEKNWVHDSEKARGRQWQGIGPLTLQVLAKALITQHPQLPALTVDNARRVCALPRSLSLILSSLGSTELLWLFPRLTTLDLANNFVSHIEGVGECSNLTSLNLSHNQLSSLAGLSELHKLEVLSVQHNIIAEITAEQVLGLHSLQVLNISANLLTRSQDIIALRALPSLRSLAAAGNPVTSQQPQLVLALLPQLVFLNGDRVNDHLLLLAATQHRNEVAEVKKEEAEKRALEEMKEKQRAAAAQHQQAGVAGLDDGSLFVLMMDGDVDVKVFLRLPGAEKLLAKYEERLNCACVQVFKTGMQHDEDRHKELGTAGDSLQEAYMEADIKARAQVLALEAGMKEASLRLEALSTQAEKLGGGALDETGSEDLVGKAEALKEETEGLLEKVAYDMLEREVVLADQVTEVIEKADSELRQMVDGFLSTAGAEFVEARHHAYYFYCQLRELAARFADSPSLMTLFSSSFSDDGKQDKENLLEAAQRVFQGEDTLAQSQASIHDRHLHVISNREQQLQQHLNSWLTSTVQAMHRSGKNGGDIDCGYTKSTPLQRSTDELYRLQADEFLLLLTAPSALTGVDLLLLTAPSALTGVDLLLLTAPAALTGVDLLLLTAPAAVTEVDLLLLTAPAALTGVDLLLLTAPAALTGVDLLLLTAPAALTGVDSLLLTTPVALTGADLSAVALTSS
ncbi:Leucine-rich repeat [Trinorchestia longiramus]|nr:Leucine-rich repeat [Trinorchestia longiramus]